MKLSARLIKRFPPATESAGFLLDLFLEADIGITVLFGASGAGKSLTLDCIAGFASPDDGQVLLGNRILFDKPTRVEISPQERQCGYVFQTNALFPHMSLRANLQFAAERRPRLERHRRVAEMIERFKLTDVAGRRPCAVSGGERQRCAIARALIAAPQLLLFDEPTRGLDAELRSEFYGLVRELRTDLNIPLLLVTHDLDEAVILGDHMIVLQEGRIVQSGAPQTVISRPATDSVARLLGQVNALQIEVLALDPARKTSRLRLIGDGLAKGELAGPYLPGHLLGDRLTMMVRADELRLHSTPGDNRLPLRLVAKREQARSAQLEFEGGVVALVPRHEYEMRSDLKAWYVEFPTASIQLPGSAS